MKKPGKSGGGAPQQGVNVMPKQPEKSGAAEPFGMNKMPKQPEKSADDAAPQRAANDMLNLAGGGKLMARPDDTRKTRKL